MFIRSQDRKILTEIHDVEIDSANQIWGSGMLIGEYSTEEKALKDRQFESSYTKDYSTNDDGDEGNGTP